MDTKPIDFQNTSRENIMRQWDYWRKQIADGHKGSAPRDWFESILDYYEEQIIRNKEVL